MKDIFVTFINERLEIHFETLKEGKFQDKQIYEFIDRAIKDLKKNPACGNDNYQELQKRVLQEKEEGDENSSNMQLLKSIDREKNNVKIDPQYGIHIPRRNISKAVVNRYGTNRL